MTEYWRQGIHQDRLVSIFYFYFLGRCGKKSCLVTNYIKIKILLIDHEIRVVYTVQLISVVLTILRTWQQMTGKYYSGTIFSYRNPKGRKKLPIKKFVKRWHFQLLQFSTFWISEAFANCVHIVLFYSSFHCIKKPTIHTFSVVYSIKAAFCWHHSENTGMYNLIMKNFYYIDMDEEINGLQY